MQDITSEYLRRLHLACERRGLRFRAERHGVKLYVFAGHTFGPERSMTLEMLSDGWAAHEGGSPLSPYDVASALVVKLQSKGTRRGAL